MLIQVSVDFKHVPSESITELHTHRLKLCAPVYRVNDLCLDLNVGFIGVHVGQNAPSFIYNEIPVVWPHEKYLLILSFFFSFY